MSQYSIKYPIVCIDLNQVKDSGVVVVFEADHLRFFKGTCEFIEQNMKHAQFCDMQGEVYVLTGIDYEMKGIRRLFNFLFSSHEIGMLKLRKTSLHFSLNQFKEQCKELIMLESIEEAWQRECEEIDQAKTFEDALCRFGLGWHDDVVE